MASLNEADRSSAGFSSGTSLFLFKILSGPQSILSIPLPSGWRALSCGLYEFPIALAGVLVAKDATSDAGVIHSQCF